jgi:hypothetical protein
MRAWMACWTLAALSHFRHNPKVRNEHPARRAETLRVADWSGEINWNAGSVGPYLSVRISRQSIDAWLAKSSCQTAAERCTQNNAPSGTRDLKPARKAFKQERVKEALRHLYPKGIPDQKIISNMALCKAVSDWIADDCRKRNLRQEEVSKDTILRAAGRR